MHMPRLSGAFPPILPLVGSPIIASFEAQASYYKGTPLVGCYGPYHAQVNAESRGRCLLDPCYIVDMAWFCKARPSRNDPARRACGDRAGAFVCLQIVA